MLGERYRRQIDIIGIGEEGQSKLKRAGAGKLLTNKLLIYDGERMIFELIGIRRNERCSSCGQRS